MNKIKGYDGYFYDGEFVYLGKDKVHIIQRKGKNINSPSVKLTNNEGVSINVTISKVKSLSGYKLVMPDDARQIPGSLDYLDREGNVYSFGIRTPQGIIKRLSKSKNGKDLVYIRIDGKGTTRLIESLLSATFEG